MESRKAFFKVITSFCCHFSEANMFCSSAFVPSVKPGNTYLDIFKWRLAELSHSVDVYFL